MKPSQALHAHRAAIRGVVASFRACNAQQLDLQIFWKTMQGDLPSLHRQIQVLAHNPLQALG